MGEVDAEAAVRRFRQIELRLVISFELEGDEQKAVQQGITNIKRLIRDPAERLAALLDFAGEVQPDRLQHYAGVAGRA